MRIPIYQIDAFTDHQFKGNPAAVCMLKNSISDDLMQNIARENNLSETAFCINKKNNIYDLRWFTPEDEIDLCGHATLGTAYVIFNFIDKESNEVVFHTKSGVLKVMKKEKLMTMVFPSRPGEKCNVTDQIILGLGKEPKELYKARDYMAVFETEDEIKNLKPDMELLKKIDSIGIIVTAKGNKVDFVSRYFAPNCGIFEDPVTGSSHCTLVPYWKGVLKKDTFVAHQLSDRGGRLYCTDLGKKIEISGEAVSYLEGYINI
ncbi:PhzF family phenazine biosynthesis protein [Clostridium sp. Mt-5]|uniref:PhzF family phenazine biosynthesis protein n=1 Tax=Clostridium moutaii TaxID=3240932 RepID=A0ABV4BPS2_9CLOT